jgi:D-alanyl-D-alanine carboxypeptidase
LAHTFLCRLGVLVGFLLALGSPAFAIPQLLLDMRTGEVLFEEDAGQPWHPASLTKLMTALVAFEAIKSGVVTLDTPVIISKKALSMPPSKVGAPVGTAYRLEDALYLLIVKSANDVAYAIAETVAGDEAAFVAQMNDFAAKLGMSATHYENPNGLHNPAQVTSARDLGVLALTIRQLYPQYANLFATESVRLGKSRLRTHNDLLTHFMGTTGMKTGFVCASGLNIVATVERNGRSLMAIVLGGSSGRERGQMAAQMFNSGFSGAFGGLGKIVNNIANKATQPVNMRPFICGKDAKEYVARRAEAFPFGLEGQPTLLTDKIEAQVYRVSSLGRLRKNVPLPVPRPLWAPAGRVETPIVPLPKPRPLVRASLRAGLSGTAF